MPRQHIVQGYESFRYRELHEVTQWKDGCIYRTKSIGYIRKEHEELVDMKRFVTSSIPTSMSRRPEFEIPVLTREEVDAL